MFLSNEPNTHGVKSSTKFQRRQNFFKKLPKRLSKFGLMVIRWLTFLTCDENLLRGAMLRLYYRRSNEDVPITSEDTAKHFKFKKFKKDSYQSNSIGHE